MMVITIQVLPFHLFILCLPELPKSKKRRILDSDEEEASATTSTSR